jgi:hypothetical protein
MVALLRKAAPFLLVAILAIGLYDGRIFYSRWRYTRDQERATKAMEAEEARRTITMLGGGKLKILEFQSVPGSIRKGERAIICYGVYGAKSVRIEPPVEALKPAVSHCLQVSPSVNTEYALVAEDDSGHSATERLTIQVGR